MSSRITSLIIAALILPFFGEAGQVAQMNARCLSVKFSRGTEPFDLFSLDLTTLDFGVNGELAPFFFQASYTHGCWLNLNDEIFGDDPTPGGMVLDTPPFADANGNGFDDFFETSQGVSGSSFGEFDFTIQSGTVEAIWNRAPGSSFGTCLLIFRYNQFQEAFRFSHTFEIIEYAGPIDYLAGSTGVAASLNLTRLNNPGATLVGMVDCLKSTFDPANELEIQPGTLTNEFGQNLEILGGDLSRDVTWPTNYFGLIEFQDGGLETADDDYYYWEVSIDDLNDTDEDGIPDFSDDPSINPPVVPNLSIELGAAEILLTINGETGRSHEILSASSIVSPSWRTNLSIVLTNDSQVISLPRPEVTTFWRAVAY